MGGAVGVLNNAESSVLRFCRSYDRLVNEGEVGSFGRSRLVDYLGKRGFMSFVDLEARWIDMWFWFKLDV